MIRRPGVHRLRMDRSNRRSGRLFPGGEVPVHGLALYVVFSDYSSLRGGARRKVLIQNQLVLSMMRWETDFSEFNWAHHRVRGLGQTPAERSPRPCAAVCHGHGAFKVVGLVAMRLKTVKGFTY